MTEPLIKPAGTIIRSIDIQYYRNNDGTNGLLGLRFKDKDANLLLQCGEFEEPSQFKINHTIVINEDERVVGLRSKTAEDGSEILGVHFEIEFLLWKMK